MVGIAVAHGDDDFTDLDIELAARECLVNPELLDVYLAALLYFGLVLASLLSFYLHSRTVAAMLELYLRTHRPAFAEVVAYIQTNVRQIETAMTLVVGIVLRCLIPIKTLTVEVARQHGLAIATYLQARQGIGHLVLLCDLPGGTRSSIYIGFLSHGTST